MFDDFFNSGTLTPLEVQGFDTVECSGTPVSKFEAFINPEEITSHYKVKTDTNVAAGATGASGQFLGIEPMSLTLKFFIDGTNTAGKPLKLSTGSHCTVSEKIQEFYTTVGFNGQIHTPKYIRIIWGHFSLMQFDPVHVFKGYLKDAQVQYKMFYSNGMPLRALITANFTELLTPTERETKDATSSPDLTHIRTVKEGDTLPHMTKEIYGDFKHYLNVARVNNLSNFRNLKPGTKIFFPPLDKKANS